MKLIDRLDGPRDELGPEAGLEQTGVLLVEGRDRLVLVTEDLDQAMARVDLLDEAVEGPGPGPLGLELLLRATGDDQRRADRAQARPGAR